MVLVTPEFGEAARTLLAGPPGNAESPQHLAERAAQTCERLATHLARLLGDSGVQLLLKRSVVLASHQLPWLASGQTGETVVSAMRTAMEQQDLESISEAFVAVLSAFVGLLERLIGEGLVQRLLAEVWPTVFPYAAKDTP
jgi:hypothetical protein